MDWKTGLGGVIIYNNKKAYETVKQTYKSVFITEWGEQITEVTLGM
jgi:hypothetical protein